MSPVAPPPQDPLPSRACAGTRTFAGLLCGAGAAVLIQPIAMLLWFIGPLLTWQGPFPWDGVLSLGFLTALFALKEAWMPTTPRPREGLILAGRKATIGLFSQALAKP